MISTKLFAIAISLHDTDGLQALNQWRDEGYEVKHSQFIPVEGKVVFCAYLEKDDEPVDFSEVATELVGSWHNCPCTPPPEPRQWVDAELDRLKG